MAAVDALFVVRIGVKRLRVQILDLGAAHPGSPAGVESGEFFHAVGDALQFAGGFVAQADESASDHRERVGRRVRGEGKVMKFHKRLAKLHVEDGQIRFGFAHDREGGLLLLRRQIGGQRHGEQAAFEPAGGVSAQRRERGAFARLVRRKAGEGFGSLGGGGVGGTRLMHLSAGDAGRGTRKGFGGTVPDRQRNPEHKQADQRQTRSGICVELHETPFALGGDEGSMEWAERRSGPSLLNILYVSPKGLVNTRKFCKKHTTPGTGRRRNRFVGAFLAGTDDLYFSRFAERVASMQTTGLFTSSQQARVRGGSSLMGTLGAALVLVFGVVLVTGLSLDRSQTAMVRFLAEKGVALISALESGVRSGTRSRTGIRLQYLVEELADRPDVRFIAVTMPDGTILAHSNPARVGELLSTQGARELGAETIAALGPSEKPSWAIMDMEGSRSFVVFKTFHPKIKGERAPDEHLGGPMPYIFLGLDLAPLEIAQAQNRERAVFLGAGVLLAGMLALLGLHAVERVRVSRRGQRVAEALAEELAVALPDGLVVFDAKGRITRLNKAALALLGMEPHAKGQAYQGRKPTDVLPGPLAELAAKLLRGPLLEDTEVVLRHGEDQRFLSVRGGHVNEGGEGRLGSLMFLRDLTEVRRLEAEVRRREKLAAVGNLAAGVAHELRNPLSSIKGYATYFGGRFPEGSADREAAQIMVKEVERLNRAIGDLIGLSRPTDIRPRMTGMRRLVEDTLRLIGQDAAGRGVSVRLDAPDELPEVAIDPDRMRQVILNLCLNGLEAMPEGGELSLSLQPEGDALRLEIRDTGMGIAPEALPHIFDPYFTTKGQGTGLGLATVHKIVEAHGGSISVTSEPGQGAVFRLLLPLGEK